jgi:hypothetical protein
VACRIQLCCWKQSVFCYKALFCQVGPFRTLAEISQNNLPPWRSPRITMDNYGQLEWEVRMMPNSCCSGAPMLCALCTSWSANWLSTSSGAANRWFAWVNFPKCWFSRHQKRNLIWCNVHICNDIYGFLSQLPKSLRLHSSEPSNSACLWSRRCTCKRSILCIKVGKPFV